MEPGIVFGSILKLLEGEINSPGQQDEGNKVIPFEAFAAEKEKSEGQKHK